MDFRASALRDPPLARLATAASVSGSSDVRNGVETAGCAADGEAKVVLAWFLQCADGVNRREGEKDERRGRDPACRHVIWGRGGKLGKNSECGGSRAGPAGTRSVHWSPFAIGLVAAVREEHGSVPAWSATGTTRCSHRAFMHMIVPNDKAVCCLTPASRTGIAGLLARKGTRGVDAIRVDG